MKATVTKNTAPRGTYAVFNATSEQIDRVQNGAYHVDGYAHETIVLLQNLTVTDSYGSDS